LGALRRLNKIGVVSRLDLISAVSGGSIIAAFIADRLRDRWPAEGTQIADWDALIEEPFRRLTEKNIRTSPDYAPRLAGVAQASELT
jgi:hypothetical protein